MLRDAAATLNSRQILWLTLAGLAVTALVVIAFLPPFVEPEWRPLIMAGYRKVCHQLPNRSFSIHGYQVALCHRCVGIWGAVPLAILLFGVLRRWDAVVSRRPGLVILFSLVPLGVDWSADVVGLWENTVLSRFLTGAIFGLVAGYFLARVIVTSSRRRDADAEVQAEPSADPV